MEILTSGSFINLENQDKIEQLKYTATELANAALETEGFVNEEEPARKLALEFWQGLEYLCRETEEAAVKNIFVSQFLARLQELRVSQSTIETFVPDETKEIDAEPSAVKTSAEDEFLGVVANEASDEKEIAQPKVTLRDTEVVSAAEKAMGSEAHDTKDETNDDDLPAETDEIKKEQVATTAGANSIEAASIADAQMLEKPATVAAAAVVVPAAAACSLPEKEPYQWGECIVTIVVQLLPVEDGSINRRAILSVRTHDFVPQISLVELSADNFSIALAPEIEMAAAKYQSELPLKVMDKLKKEKATPKKHHGQSAVETKPGFKVPAKNNDSGSSQPLVEEGNQAESTNPSVAAAPPQVETSSGHQGSLF